MLQMMSTDLASLTAFADATNALFTEPCALPTSNLVAKADPLAPGARWALDVRQKNPLASNPTGKKITWLSALDMTLLAPTAQHYVAAPPGVTMEEWAGPEWFAPVVGP
jgi:hypothetical protein